MPTIVTASLETAINTYLGMDPHTLNKCRDLAGKVVKVEIGGMGLTLFVLPKAGGIQLLQHYEGIPDAVISGSPFALFKASLTDTEAMQDISITGDVELGQRFHRLLRDMDIDWEEHISKITGDVIAHQLGNIARAAKRFCANTRDSMQANISEFLHEEARHLPPREELEDFYSDVSQTRNDVDRIAQRIEQLQIKD